MRLNIKNSIVMWNSTVCQTAEWKVIEGSSCPCGRYLNTKFPSPLFPRGEGETEYERPYLPPSLSPHVASSRHGASAVTFVSGESHSHRSGKRKEHTSELWESVAICYYSQEPTVVPSNTWRRHNFLYGNETFFL